jgi:hypothetical protein
MVAGLIAKPDFYVKEGFLARLPIPGSDISNWGDILNAFLRVEHNEDGSLKLAATVANKYTQPAGGIPAAHLADDVQASLARADASVSGLQNLQTATNSALTDLQTATNTAITDLQTSTTNAFSTAQTATTSALANKETVITPSDVTRYYRGDKTWQPLDKAAVGLGNVTNQAQLPLTGGTLTGNLLVGGSIILSNDPLNKRLTITDSTAPATGNRILMDTYASPNAALPSGLFGWNNQTLSNAAAGVTHSFVAAMKNNTGTNTNFAGTLTQAIGIWLPGDIRGSGTIGEYYSIKAGIAPASGNTVRITNYYGLSIESPNATTTYSIANHYGIRIKDQTVVGSPNAYALYTGTGKVRFGDDVTIAGGKNIITDTTTGLKVTTSATQKLGFYGATPIVQPLGGALTAGTTYTANEQLMLTRMWTALRSLGLLS